MQNDTRLDRQGVTARVVLGLALLGVAAMAAVPLAPQLLIDPAALQAGITAAGEFAGLSAGTAALLP